MSVSARNFLLLPVLLGLGVSSACIQTPREQGSFEKTLTVSGPVDLEVANGAGDVRVSIGPAGKVHVQGQFRVLAGVWENAPRIAEEFRSSPPVEQQGDFIRVGKERERWHRVHVDYTITVPPETEVRISTGSGDVVVQDRKSTRLNSSHLKLSRMPSSA